MSRYLPFLLVSCACTLLIAACATPADNAEPAPVATAAAPAPSEPAPPTAVTRASTAPPAAPAPAPAPVLTPVPPTPPAPATAPAPPAEATLKSAIPFTATSLAGDKIEFPQAYAGKLVLVSFWASWCPHCRREIPYWRDAFAKYHAEGLEMIGLVTDKTRGTTADKIVDFIRENEVTWPQIFDDAPRLSQSYGARGVPMSFLIDADTGAVLAQKREIRKEALAKAIEEQLAIKKGRASPAGQPAAEHKAADQP
jgi:peroxiredoxin